jgi:hypothetical protein
MQKTSRSCGSLANIRRKADSDRPRRAKLSLGRYFRPGGKGYYCTPRNGLKRGIGFKSVPFLFLGDKIE